MLTTKQMSEFEDLAKPLIKWLNKNGNPHSSIKIEVDSATLYMGLYSIYTPEFTKD